MHTIYNLAGPFGCRFDTADSSAKDHANDDVRISARLWDVTRVILNAGDENSIAKLNSSALERLEHQLPFELRRVWLSALVQIDPRNAVEALEAQVETVEPSELSEAVILFASLFGDRYSTATVAFERYTPQMLLVLTRLAYRHVRVADDVTREGIYSPDERDDAERARNDILTALFNSKGEAGLAAKLELSTDPLCVHFKDRIISIADESWAQEIDRDLFDEKQVLELESSREAPAGTNEAMFGILKDRLSELDDLLLGDTSPREAWAGIRDEKIMRREIARELKYKANSIYTVDQEAVTGDEKETDIRLRSTASPHEAIIELKLGDDRSARDLRDTIEDQLVKKYMAASNCRSGALLVTIAKDRKWKHPDINRMIGIEGLLILLRTEAERVQEASRGSLYLHAHLLDLRNRLPTEAEGELAYP